MQTSIISGNGAPEQPEPDAVPQSNAQAVGEVPAQPVELGGRGGLEPTRYGDWEKNGRCIDF